ncbi:MAG: hypothetical protein ACTSQS_10460, partial [Promethearchaeota archaeon]
SLFILAEPGYAMIFFLLAFLLSIVLWIYMTASTVEKIFHSKEYISVGKDKFRLICISILIYTMILYIFITGNSFAWWRMSGA